MVQDFCTALWHLHPKHANVHNIQCARNQYNQYKMNMLTFRTLSDTSFNTACINYVQSFLMENHWKWDRLDTEWWLNENGGFVIKWGRFFVLFFNVRNESPFEGDEKEGHKGCWSSRLLHRAAQLWVIKVQTHELKDKGWFQWLESGWENHI